MSVDAAEQMPLEALPVEFVGTECDSFDYSIVCSVVNSVDVTAVADTAAADYDVDQTTPSAFEGSVPGKLSLSSLQSPAVEGSSESPGNFHR